MMKFLHVALAVLSLLSVGQSAPVSSCESLIQPREINGTEEMLGTWTYIAESTNIPASKLLTKMFVDSSRVKVTAGNESDTVNIIQSQKMFGRCIKMTHTMTLEKSTFTAAYPFPLSSTLLSTGCSDCYVFYANFTIGGRTYNSAQIMSKRNKLEEAELEEFVKQLECLNLPTPAIMDPEKGFCLDDSPSQETDVTDVNQIMAEMGSEILGLMDSILNSEDGIKLLLNMVSASNGPQLQ